MSTTHVLLSGGLDSTTALAWAKASIPGDFRAVSIDYGQRHRREIIGAGTIAAAFGVNWRVLDLRAILSAGPSSLTDRRRGVPHGHYTDDTMAATVVQGRNLLFAAAVIASSSPGDRLVMGMHAGDHAIYADCRPDFTDALELAVEAYDVELLVPFIDKTKADIVHLAEGLRAPLALTWSCYEGGDIHCGRCGTCVERAEAFHVAGVADPTTYADANFWRTAVDDHAAGVTR